MHYFWRRIEWEEHSWYLGDEDDILVYYLSEGLTVRKELRDQNAVMLLQGRSKELWRYYLSVWSDPDSTVPRPRRMLTDWWIAIIRRVENMPSSTKWDIICLLLDLNFEQQQAFEERFGHVIQRIREYGNDSGENALIVCSHESESNGVVVVFAYRDLSADERNRRAASLVDQAKNRHSASRVVVIGRDVARNSFPYDFLAFDDGLIH